MDDRKIIAVVGSTGAQGGGLARAILNDVDHEFAVRAITRNPASERARALAALGAEVVAADVDDRASLTRAFEGAHGAYCVTFFWDHFSVEREISEAHNLAAAAAAAGVRHAIWSTLEDTREWLPLDDPRMPAVDEKYNVPHFDGKGEANQFFVDAHVPTTFLLTSFYWENFIVFGADGMGPRPDSDGALALTIPMGKARLPGIAAEDIGKCALGILRRGDELIGRSVGIAGEHLSGDEMAAAFARALGRDVYYNEISPDAYRDATIPGRVELGNMLQFKRDFEQVFAGARDVAFSRSLNPDLQTFDAWLAANKERIPIG